MYPRNAASPEPIAIGPVVQISDGAVQTSGVAVRIKPIGVAEADGGGTVSYSTDGVVIYTPTQAETNYTSFVLIAKKTGCIPVSITVVTSEDPVAGRVSIGSIKGTQQTAGDLAALITTLTGYVDTEVAAILTAVDTEVAAIKAKTDNLPADPADASDIAASFSTLTSLVNGLNNLSEAGVRTAVGMASANLDTQLSTISALIDTEVAAILAAVDTEVAAVKAKTDQFTFTNAGKVDASLQAATDVVAAVCNKLADHIRRRTQANTEASSDGDTLSLFSIYGMIQQIQNSGPMASGVLPIRKTDGSTLDTLTFTSSPSAEPVTGVTP